MNRRENEDDRETNKKGQKRGASLSRDGEQNSIMVDESSPNYDVIRKDIVDGVSNMKRERYGENFEAEFREDQGVVLKVECHCVVGGLLPDRMASNGTRDGENIYEQGGEDDEDVTSKRRIGRQKGTCV